MSLVIASHVRPAARTVRHPAAPILAALAGSMLAAVPAQAQPANWNTANGVWSTGANWFPGAPAPLSSVFIGNTAAAANATVTLNVNATVASLSITDGMGLNTTNRRLTVTGDTSVSGVNILHSRLRLEAGPNPSIITNDLSVGNGAVVQIRDGLANVSGQLVLSPDATLDGNGSFIFTSPGLALLNGGRIEPADSGVLTLQNYEGGRFDLDGPNGVGVIDLTAYDPSLLTGAHLVASAAGLSDPFSGSILLAPQADLYMNLTEGWVADAPSEIIMTGLAGSPANTATIRGSPLDFAGSITLTGPAGAPADAGRLSIFSEGLVLRPQTEVEVVPGGSLLLGGAMTTQIDVLGGTYDVADSGRLTFNGPTNVEGGTFSTNTLFVNGGDINFSGPTTWDGVVNFSGYARQTGDATVVGPTTINAGRFVMSQLAGIDWTINNAFVINAESIGSTPGNGFAGDLFIEAGVLSRLTVNLTDLADYWVINGHLHLQGVNDFTIIRVAGSPLHASGEVSVTGGRVQINADTWFLGCIVNIDPSAVLRMTGQTDVSHLADFQGAGLLRNAAAGVMSLSQGANLNQVGLTNDGILEISDDNAGAASVDRFTAAPGSVWNVDIGGQNGGPVRDLLIVSGGQAVLDGSLNVRVFDSSEGQHLPHPGDEFTILTSLSAVSGAFDANPVSIFDGRIYAWTIVYLPNAVVLRLDSVNCLLADFNHDGVVDPDDLSDYISCYFAPIPCPEAELNGDGVINPDDLSDYIALFFSGC